MMVAFGVGMQLPTCRVVERPSNARAGEESYLYSSKFVRIKVG